MPAWGGGADGYRMYETTDGTPVSPAFATPEALARWLAETGASAFGALAAGLETWLPVARGERRLDAAMVRANL